MTDLFRQHTPLALAIARDWYLPGHDHEDTCQEALIGLWVAVDRYDPDTGVPFPRWARQVINGWLAKKVRDARRPNRMLLTHADRDERTLARIPAVHLTEDLWEQAESVRALVQAVRRLSDSNRHALRCRANDQKEPSANAFRTLDRALRKELGMTPPKQKKYG